MTKFKLGLMAGAAALAFTASARADNDRNQHGKAPQPAHVLLISVDGMHGVDLANYVKSHPASTFATLANRGTTYANAYTTAPSDSFPGMIAQVTGGTPYSAEVWYDDSYDRTLDAPNNLSNNAGCAGAPGTETQFAENIDKDHTLSDITGGGTLGQPLTQIDPAALPLALVDGQCAPVYPHQFIRVNTLFEVMRAHGLHTAWSDKHPAYEILNGPSGQGIEDLYTPEINSQIPGFTDGNDNTTSFTAVRNYDQIKVNAILHEIDGLPSTGGGIKTHVPNVFGMNFQSVSVGQKLAKSGDLDPAGLAGGYLDAAGTPGNALSLQIDFVDGALAQMVNELKARGLYDSTVVIVSAKHGQSPIDVTLRRAIKDTYSSAITHGYAFDIADDASLVWLDPAKQKADYAAALNDLRANAAALGIDEILARADLLRYYQDPFHDSRTPDFLVKSQHGVIYTGGSKLAEHGGLAGDDRHVAMLVSAKGLTGATVDREVATTQIAPTILGVFGIAPTELQAVRREGTQILPGLSIGPQYKR